MRLKNICIDRELKIEVCQIDNDGRIISMDKNKGKLSIIEQEFKSAEAEELRRLKEEEEMRVRCACTCTLNVLTVFQNHRGESNENDMKHWKKQRNKKKLKNLKQIEK